MQLCFGCQHAFPPNAVDDLPFSDDLASKMHSLRALVSKLQPTTPAMRRCVAEMEEDIKRVTLSIHREMELRDHRMGQLQAQLKFLAEQEEARRQREAAPPPSMKPQRPTRSATASSPYASNLLQRFMVASQMSPTPKFNSPRTLPVENRFGETVGMSPAGHGGGGGYRAMRPVDLVSATLHLMMESLVVRTGAGLCALWFQQHENDELIAPFVISRDSSQQRGVTAPYRASLTTVAGITLQTGIAVNIGQTDRALASSHVYKAKQTVNHQLTSQNGPSLTVPVFHRYGEAAKTVVGVLQLMHPRPPRTCFDEEDERFCASVAALLAHPISSYRGAMLSDWCNRLYDASALAQDTSYSVFMDESASPVLPAPPHSISMYRGTVTADAQGPGGIAGSRLTKGDVAMRATTTELMDNVKELHRYCKTLESSWKNAVAAQTLLERKNMELSHVLDGTRQSLNDARRALEASKVARSATASSSTTAAARQTSDDRRSTVAFDPDELEAETMTRLQDQRKKQQQRKSKTGAATTFLTED